jgi:FAD/FMN-containing dehydrogenase
MTREGWVKELIDVLGSEKVSDNPVVLACYATQGSWGRTPSTIPRMKIIKCVCVPETVKDVQNIVKIADKHKLSIVPAVTDMMERWRAAPFSGLRPVIDVWVDLSRMDKIIEINTDEAYAVVEPGVNFYQLGRELEKHGYWVTCGSYPPTASVFARLSFFGQNLPTRIGDWTLGYEIVLPDGSVRRTQGGEINRWFRFHTNTFPVRLAELISMAPQLFGIVTKYALIIRPKFERSEIIFTGFKDYESALKASTATARRFLQDGSFIWNWAAMLAKEAFLDPNFAKTNEYLLHYTTRAPWDVPQGFYYNYMWAVFHGGECDVEARIREFEDITEHFGGKIISEEEIEDTLPYTYYDIIESERDHKHGLGATIGHFAQAGGWFSVLLVSRHTVMPKIEQFLVRKFWEDYGVNMPYYSERPHMGAHQPCYLRVLVRTDALEEVDPIYTAYHNTMISNVLTATLNEFHRDILLDNFIGLYQYAESIKALGEVVSGIKVPKPPPNRAELTTMAYEKVNISFVPIVAKIKRALDPNLIISPWSLLSYEPSFIKDLIKMGKLQVIPELLPPEVRG